jgi:photosystem II stability/assembly factor-like uncharacterized protein
MSFHLSFFVAHILIAQIVVASQPRRVIVSTLPAVSLPKSRPPVVLARLIKLRLLAVVLIFLLGACAERSGTRNTPQWVAGPNVGKLDLMSVDLLDAKTGWVVGDIDPGGAGGAIYQTTDGCKTWRSITHTDEILTTIHFVNRTTGWVTGLAGRIERTDDGGLSWKVQRNEREGEPLNGMFFIDERRGWVVGGSGLVLRTTNGGETWTQTNTGRIEDLWAVRFSSSEHGWIVGENGLILATTDGGNTWAPQTSQTSRALLGLTITPSNVAIAVGEAGTILRGEGGSNWSVVDCALTVTLSSVAASDKVVIAVGSRGATLESTDEGRSWTAMSALLKRDLNSIDLSDPTHGVAVGRGGVTQCLQ